jgi:GT2 family glycosyltransferase
MAYATGSDGLVIHDEGARSADEIFRGTAIVILTWNELDETRRCLQSLQTAGYELDRVVLWDNGSSDGTEESITREFPSVIYHRNPTNLGVASGRNAAASMAIRALSPSHVLFLDNDMVVTPGFIEPLCDVFAAEPSAAQALAKIRILDDPDRLQSAGGTIINFALGVKHTIGHGEIDIGLYDERKLCLPCGGATLVAASVFLELGGFDPIFDPFGTEDMDFAYRVRDVGYEAWYVPESVVYHGHWSKLSSGARAELFVADIMKHWMIMLSRHASMGQRLVFFSGGAFVGLLRFALREISKGDIAVMKRISLGLWICAREMLRWKALEKESLLLGTETD